MIIAVLKEPAPETRVSLLPEHIATLHKWNCTVWIEQDAGRASFAPDQKYIEAGAVIQDRAEILSDANLILSINPLPPPPPPAHLAWLLPGIGKCTCY